MSTHNLCFAEAVLTSTHNLCFAEAVLTSTHNLCFEQKYEKNIKSFYLKIFRVFKVKFSMYLNRRVFVLAKPQTSLLSRASGQDFRY